MLEINDIVVECHKFCPLKFLSDTHTYFIAIINF